MDFNRLRQGKLKKIEAAWGVGVYEGVDFVKLSSCFAPVARELLRWRIRREFRHLQPAMLQIIRR